LALGLGIYLLLCGCDMDFKMLKYSALLVVTLVILITLVLYLTNDWGRGKSGANTEDAVEQREATPADEVAETHVYGTMVGNDLKAFMSDNEFFDADEAVQAVESYEVDSEGNEISGDGSGDNNNTNGGGDNNSGNSASGENNNTSGNNNNNTGENNNSNNNTASQGTSTIENNNNTEEQNDASSGTNISIDVRVVNGKLVVSVLDEGGSVVTGQEFVARLNKLRLYKDDDKDGVIHIDDAGTGTHIVSLQEMDGFNVTNNDVNVTIE